MDYSGDSTIALLRSLTEMRRSHAGVYLPVEVQDCAQAALMAYYRAGGMAESRPPEDVIISAALETLREWAFVPLFQLVSCPALRTTQQCQPLRLSSPRV